MDRIRAIAGARLFPDIVAAHADRGHRHQVVEAGGRIARRGHGIDQRSADIEGHQSERLLARRTADPAAWQQLHETRVGREAAIARRREDAAVSRAVEPSGVANYGEAKRPGAGGVETRQDRGRQLRGRKAVRPIVAISSVVFVAEVARMSPSPTRRLEREADPVGRRGHARGRHDEKRKKQGAQSRAIQRFIVWFPFESHQGKARPFARARRSKMARGGIAWLESSRGVSRRRDRTCAVWGVAAELGVKMCPPVPAVGRARRHRTR